MPIRRTKYEGRRKRYIVAASVAAVVIPIALYYAAEANPYKNQREWNFDSYRDNSEPEDFVALQTGTGGKESWLIKSDGSAVSKPNVLARSGNYTEASYPVLIVPERGYTNFKASVKFKIVAGEKEQVAGLVFRFEDKNHYFVLTADSINSRFSLCRFEPDKLICTQDVRVSVTAGEWHTITAHVATQGIAGYLDDKLLVQRYDAHYPMGTIGLWAKGDSAVYYDDLTIEY